MLIINVIRLSIGIVYLIKVILRRASLSGRNCFLDFMPAIRTKLTLGLCTAITTEFVTHNLFHTFLFDKKIISKAHIIVNNL